VNTLYRDDLEDLIKDRDGLRVSLYMPTHRKGVETQQDPIRLKNLLASAEERLRDEGLRRPEAKELVAPAEKLLADSLYWQHQSDGLALFVAEGSLRDYRLPFSFEELVVAADRYHLKPLLRLLSGDGRFYVLAISQDEVRLLQGTRYSVGEVDLDGVPQGLEELLAGERVPLVLAGVDYLLPIYREANTYGQLARGRLCGRVRPGTGKRASRRHIPLLMKARSRRTREMEAEGVEGAWAA
jgi:hypothetical protein